MSVLLVLSLGTAFLETFCFSGIIFGWTFLQEVLVDEEYFAEQCFNETIFNSSGVNTTNSTHILNCDSQEASFSLIYTLSASLLQILAFPCGYLIDRVGTWIFRTLTCAMITLGFILLTISDPATSVILYPAFILIAVFGYGLLMTNIQLANLTKSTRAFLVTLINGLFGSSTVIFFLFKKGYDSGTNIYLIFQILTWGTIFLWIRTFLFMPRHTIPFPLLDDSVKYGWKEWRCFKNKTSSKSYDFKVTVNTVSNQTENLGTQEDLHLRASFKTCLGRPLFWTNIFFFSLNCLRMNFILGNVIFWLNSFGDENEVLSFTDALGYILMCGVLIAPLNGILIDVTTKFLKKSTQDRELRNLKASLVSMLSTWILAVFLSITLLVHSVYASFVFMLLGRSFIYGGNAAFVAINFPHKHFGKLFGLTCLVSGLTNFLQYAFIEIILTLDPTFFYVDLGFLILVVSSLVHPIFIWITIKKHQV